MILLLPPYLPLLPLRRLMPCIVPFSRYQFFHPDSTAAHRSTWRHSPWICCCAHLDSFWSHWIVTSTYLNTAKRIFAKETPGGRGSLENPAKWRVAGYSCSDGGSYEPLPTQSPDGETDCHAYLSPTYATGR